MDKTTLVSSLPPKGGFVTVVTERNVKTRKGFDLGTLKKRTTMQLRVGHNYYAQRSTRNAHESGERSIASSDSLWHRQSELHSALRVHKKDSAKVYLAGQPCGNPARSTFLLNGSEVEKQEVESFLLASEKRDSNSDWIFVAIETIETIR